MGDEFESSPSAVTLDGEIQDAMDALRTGVRMLLDIGDRGDLMALGPRRLIDLARAFEGHRASLEAVDSLVVEAVREEDLVAQTRARSLHGALAELLRISVSTARSRVARAAQIQPRNGFSTGVLECELPVLGTALRSGEITCDQAREIGLALDGLGRNPAVSPDERARAEALLVQQAAAFGPEDLRKMARKIDDVLIPDGALPREEIAQARRGLVIGPERKDGTHEVSGRVTRELHALLHAALSPLAAPRPCDEVGPDPRTAPQRMHDALQDACTRLLDMAGLPASGGTPATLHITIDADRLAESVHQHAADLAAGRSAGGGTGRAAGTTALGDQLTLPEILRLAEQAEIIPTYLNSAGGIVGYGRTRRTASASQTNAMIARDGGCSFPSCTAPPDWCQRHHVIPWWIGGLTDLDNLTLVCGFHHREFGRRGWAVVMSRGVPFWIPPAYIDPTRTPITNARVLRSPNADLDLDLESLRDADPTTGSAEAGLAPDADSLDAVSDLADLLALHVPQGQRDRFYADLAGVLDGYEGTRLVGALASVAAMA